MGLRLESQEAHACLADLLVGERYDLMQVEGIEMAAYGLAALTAQPHTRLVFDDHNAGISSAKTVGIGRSGQPSALAGGLLQSDPVGQKLQYYEQMIRRCCRCCGGGERAGPLRTGWRRTG